MRLGEQNPDQRLLQLSAQLDPESSEGLPNAKLQSQLLLTVEDIAAGNLEFPQSDQAAVNSFSHALVKRLEMVMRDRSIFLQSTESLSVATAAMQLLPESLEVLVAKGGQGGVGARAPSREANFRNQERQMKAAEETGAEIIDIEDVNWKKDAQGLPGQELGLHLLLRVVADVGIVGFPNAGKSSLLKALTRADPEVAPYPFTTLMPNLGVLASGGPKGGPVLADLPGLIEGAHAGRGLGRMFLRHLRRTQVILHVVDASAADPATDYYAVREELRMYNPAYCSRPHVVALNKMDLEDARDLCDEVSFEVMSAARRHCDEWAGEEIPPTMPSAVVPVSAISGHGLKELNRALNLALNLVYQEDEAEAKEVEESRLRRDAPKALLQQQKWQDDAVAEAKQVETDAQVEAEANFEPVGLAAKEAAAAAAAATAEGYSDDEDTQENAPPSFFFSSEGELNEVQAEDQLGLVLGADGTLERDSDGQEEEEDLEDFARMLEESDDDEIARMLAELEMDPEELAELLGADADMTRSSAGAADQPTPSGSAATTTTSTGEVRERTRRINRGGAAAVAAAPTAATATAEAPSISAAPTGIQEAEESAGEAELDEDELADNSELTEEERKLLSLSETDLLKMYGDV